LSLSAIRLEKERKELMKIDEENYKRIGDMIRSENSPVGIDAVKTHILILYKLEQIEERLQAVELKLNRSED
jgi:hypothetical protein